MKKIEYKEELLEFLKPFPDGVIEPSVYNKDGIFSLEEDTRAYKKIVALIGASKEVTEEWIEEKTSQLIVGWFHKWREMYTKREMRIEAKDFIRSLVEEIWGKWSE